MKIFPIKTEKVTPTRHKTVEWSLHNVCNYNCTYCGEENKIGDRRWKSLDTYKMYVDKLIAATGPNPWFLITGGEPTLYPKFIELMTYLKSKGAFICLSTNGSRTLRWWEECRDAQVIDSLYVTYHTESSADYKHIADVLNLFHDYPTKTICFITHTHNTMDLVKESTNYLCENTGSKIEVKHMVIPNYDMYAELSTEQLEFTKKTYTGKKPNKVATNISTINQYENNILITYNDGSTEIANGSQDIIKQNKNNFFGWQCNVNNDVLSVNVNLCRYGQTDCKISGIVADLDVEPVAFVDEFISCPYKSCYCSGNLYSAKYKKIE